MRNPDRTEGKTASAIRLGDAHGTCNPLRALDHRSSDETVIARHSRSSRAETRATGATFDGPRVLDPAALGDHFERLFRAAYGLCGRREDAEDLVQETYARVLRRPRLLRRDDDIVYLLRALRNTWISGHRAALARPVAGDLAEVEWVADPCEDPAVAALELRAIYAAVKDLPEALRETVVAVDVVGLSYRQAARALGTKQGTIMSRLYRARVRSVSQLG